jgi:hypothetical protein
MRVTANPLRSTQVIELDTARGSLTTSASQRVGTPPQEMRSMPARGSRRGRTTAWIIACLAIALAALVVVAFVANRQSAAPSGGTSHTPFPSTSLTSGGLVSTPAVSGTPSLTSVSPSLTAPSNDRTKPPPENPSTTSDFNGARGFLLVFVLAALLTAVVVAVRRRSRRGVSRVPQEQAAGSDGIDRHEAPKASLGTPDVLVLTPATTDDDQRLRDRLAQETSAIFANLQLACSFEPAQEWKFDSARLTVKLARADGLPAPAPIAYSLRPLTEHDGTARENNVEIGADVKFVTVKAGEKQTRGGNVFVRGYGLQESTSYWQFTPTRNRRLEGSFWLWLIAKAPVETDLGHHVFTARPGVVEALVVEVQDSTGGRDRRDRSRARSERRTALSSLRCGCIATRPFFVNRRRARMTTTGPRTPRLAARTPSSPATIHRLLTVRPGKSGSGRDEQARRLDHDTRSMRGTSFSL